MLWLHILAVLNLSVELMANVDLGPLLKAPSVEDNGCCGWNKEFSEVPSPTSSSPASYWLHPQPIAEAPVSPPSLPALSEPTGLYHL